LFQCKIFLAKSFFKKIIFSKIFSNVWFAQKNYEMWKSKSGNCHRNLETSGRCCWIPTSRFGLKWPRSGQIRLDLRHFGQIQPAFDHGRITARFWLVSGQPVPATVTVCHLIPVAGCCRIPAPAGFWRPTIAGFQQLDI